MTKPGFQASMIAFVLAVPLAFAGAAGAEESPLEQAGKPVVSDIIIRHATGEAIKHQMRTRVGREFDESVLQADVRALHVMRQFANVSVDHQDDGPGQIKVLVHIRDWPAIERITYHGAHKWRDRDLDAVAGLRYGGPCNPADNKAACRKIARYLQANGYPRARCDLVKGGASRDTEVKFEINLGVRVPK